MLSWTWAGFFLVAFLAGLFRWLVLMELRARGFDPLLRRLCPGVPVGHPAGASIVMSLSANMVSLDSAATPLGPEAMKELQQLNPQPNTASNDPTLFL